jgi:hypothetical protein
MSVHVSYMYTCYAVPRRNNFHILTQVTPLFSKLWRRNCKGTKGLIPC